jgi:Protein of unknown function (DUF1549)/Protein of unknown function (DUF1553)
MLCPKVAPIVRPAGKVLLLAVVLGGLVQNVFAQAPPLHARIDELVTQAHVGPLAPPAGDGEFARRVYLDLTGMVPSSAELAAFVADASADKRTKLIDQLLASPRYVRHMANVFDVMWMERRPDKHVPAAEWQQYLLDSFTANKPYDQLAREVLSSDGVDPATRPAAKFFLDREAEPNLMTRDIGRIFFGRDYQCNQCHNHPLIDDYLQPDYYGIFAFVNRTELFTGKDKKVVLMDKADGEVSYQSVFDPTAKGITWPRIPGGKQVEEPKFNPGEEYVVAPAKEVRHVPKYSRRLQLAAQIVPTNKPFNRNIANRLWGQMLGRALVEPVEFQYAANPPSNPQLLEMLADDFAAMKYDIKGFLREIVLSQAYQRAMDLPADVAAQAVAAQARLAALEAEQKTLADVATASSAAAGKIDTDLAAARKTIPVITEEVTKASAPIAEVKKASDAAAKGVADATAPIAPKQDILKALAEAAAKAKEAAAKLPAEKDLAEAAAKFQGRADQVTGEVAALVKVVEQKTVEAKAASDKLAAVQAAVAEVNGRLDVARKQVMVLEEQHDATTTKYRLDMAARILAERKVASAKDLTQYTTLVAATQASKANQEKLAADLAAAKTTAVKLAADLPALQTAQTAAQKVNEEATSAQTAAKQAVEAKQAVMKEFVEVLAKAQAASAKLPQDAELAATTLKLKTRGDQLTAEVAEGQKVLTAKDDALKVAVAQLAAAAAAVTANTTQATALTHQIPALEAQQAPAAEKAKADAVAFDALAKKIPDDLTAGYAVRPLKQLSPEQFGWSVLQVTGVYRNYTIATTAELDKAKPLTDADRADPAKMAERRKELERGVHAKLAGSVTIFIQLMGNSAGAPQSDFFATVDQALFLANGGTVKSWLAPSGENLTARLMALPDNKALADELYFSVLSRKPTGAEIAEVNQYLAARPNDKPVAVQEMAWGLISSTEFRFNH